jgi:hypothetical protein
MNELPSGGNGLSVSEREYPKGQVSLGMFKAEMAMRHGPGAVKTSGAQLLDFERGWAIPAFRHGEAVHYLRVVRDELHGACGVRFPLPVVKGQGVALFGQGDFKRCVKCQRKVDRKA